MRQDNLFHDDLAQEFYGLDSETLAVDSVSFTKSGKMYRWTVNDGYICAQLCGPSTQAEVARHFGPTYLVAVELDAQSSCGTQLCEGFGPPLGY